ISLDLLADAGLLGGEDIGPLSGARPDRVSFAAVRRFKEPRLRKAFQAFRRRGRDARFERVLEAERWLEGYALFSATRAAPGGEAWTRWEPDLRRRRPAALRRARRALRDEVELQEFLQFVFWSQWERLGARCRRLGVRRLGDVAFYVGHDSDDV